jgi:hypothetical protein
MTQLSRLAILGMAPEATPGTYVAPTAFIPFTKADYEDMYTELKDTSMRANDSVLQGIYQGPAEADWSIDLLGYPDLIGNFLRGIIGPDTITAGISTSLSATVASGVTSITTVASIAANSYISIYTGANQEFALVTAVSGAGPYTLTVTTVVGQSVGLAKGHMSGVAVASQTTHTFKQNSAVARRTYSLSVFDTTSGTNSTLGYTYAAFSDVQLKIDPKAIVSLSTKLKAQTGLPQPALVPVYTALPALLGWQWTVSNSGVSSTRGLTVDLTIKRAVDPIHASTGLQTPREVFQGALEVDGTYKAIFENQTDLNLFLNYTQTPMVITLLQPAAVGGASLALTMSQAGIYKGKRDFSTAYVQANFSLSGIFNSIDTGSSSAVLKNFITTAY